MRLLAKVMIYSGAVGVFGSCVRAHLNRENYYGDKDEKYVVSKELELAGLASFVGCGGFSLLRRESDRDRKPIFDWYEQ